jgi:two-component system, LuxR family, sensor kinase FixL
MSAMGQMAAMVAHELNQPLTAISNYMEAIGALLDRGGDLPLPRLRSAVERAGEQAIRAGEIIQRLRGFASRRDTEKRIEPIPPLLKEAAALALVGTRQKGIVIKIDNDLADVPVLADKIQIQQVQLNLCATPPKRLPIRNIGKLPCLPRQAMARYKLAWSIMARAFLKRSRPSCFSPLSQPKRPAWGLACRSVTTSLPPTMDVSGPNPTPTGAPFFAVTLPIALIAGPVDA